VSLSLSISNIFTLFSREMRPQDSLSTYYRKKAVLVSDLFEKIRYCVEVEVKKKSASCTLDYTPICRHAATMTFCANDYATSVG
jgi:hypothetical protein